MPNNLSQYIAAPLINVQGDAIANTYKVVDESGVLPAGDVLLTVQELSLIDTVQGLKGVFLTAEDSPETLNLPLDKLNLIAIEFAGFVDGRGYSFAALLRRQGFKGELRAVGDVFKDVLFYLKRSGFNTFAIKAGKDVLEAKAGLQDFSQSYQASVVSNQTSYQVGSGQ